MDRHDRELESARIIDSPLFDEAFQEVTNDIVNRIAECDSTKIDELQALQIELKTVAHVKFAIEYFLQMGKIVNHNEALQKSVN